MKVLKLTKTDKAGTLVDGLMYFVAFAYPLTTIPQIVTIFAHHSAKDISLISWLLYAICAVITLFYALLHKLRPLIIAGVLWVAMYSLVIVGILLYR